MDKLVDIARRPSVQRAAIVAYVACLAGLIVVFVFISMMQVEHAAYIQAAPTLEKERPNVMRGMVLDAQRGTRLTGAIVEVELLDGSYEGDETLERVSELDPTQIARGRTERSGYVHLAAEVPAERAAGEQALVLRAESSGIDEFRVGRTIEVVERSVATDYWPERTDRLPEDDERRGAEIVRDSEGPIRIDVLPADAQVSRGLRSRVYLRTTDRDTGAPVAAKLRFEEAEGMREGKFPERLETDRLGLARVDFVPVTDQSWTLEAQAAGQSDQRDKRDKQGKQDQSEPSRTKLDIQTTPAQVSLQMQDVLAVAGRPVDGAVDSLSGSGGLMVDLYNGDDWVDASTFGLRREGSGVRVNVPELDDRGLLYRVQVYGSLYDPGGAWDVEYLVAADGRQLSDYQQAAQALAEYISEHSDDSYFGHLAEQNIFATTTSRTELRGWIEAMLLAVPRHFDAPPILINSQKQARDELDAWKKDVKADLILLTALALLIGLAVVGYLVLMGIRNYRDQNRMLRDVDFEMSLDEDEYGGYGQGAGELDRSIAHGNVVAGLQIFIVVMTLILFTLGILLLLSYL